MTRLPRSPADRAERLHRLLERAGASCAITRPGGEVLRCGAAPPAFGVAFRSPRSLRGGLDEFSLGRAYIDGEIDLEGDPLAILSLRGRLSRRPPLSLVLRFLADLFLRPARSVNRASIAYHYGLPDEFFLAFVDTAYRLYSHGLFGHETDTLEHASERKLRTMYEALQLHPGARLLDVGAGWGAVTRYCGRRGVHVTSLTLAGNGGRHIEDLIRREGLPGEVHQADFLDYRPACPYDAVAMIGVVEHIPNYRRLFQQAWDCLRPGGLLYLDGATTPEKYRVGALSRRYIWPGTTTFICLPDLIRELQYHGLELLGVWEESRDYELTMRHWAERLDATRERTGARWGEPVYRAFRLYLWGGVHAFGTGLLHAYHLLARRGPAPGPRPGLARRVVNFLLGLI